MLLLPDKSPSDHFSRTESEAPPYEFHAPGAAKSDNWTESINHLRNEMTQYNKAVSAGDANSINRAVENVATAMEDVANCTNDPKMKKAYRKKAHDFRRFPREHDGAMKTAKKGLFMVLAAPIAVVGAGFYAAGSILEGVSLMLKAVGTAGRKPLVGASRL